MEVFVRSVSDQIGTMMPCLPILPRKSLQPCDQQLKLPKSLNLFLLKGL